LLPPDIVPVVPLAGPVAETVRQGASGWPVEPILVASAQGKFDAFAASTAALTKSGTSTLELAVARVPMVVTYRINPISHVAVKFLAKIQYASILNLLLDGMVVPEFLQYDATPERLAAAVRQLLDDPSAVAAQRAGFDKALTMLRPLAGAPSGSAAEAVLSLLEG